MLTYQRALAGSLAGLILGLNAAFGGEPALTSAALREAPASLVPAAGKAPAALAAVKIVREWDGSVCRARLVNEGPRPARIQEIVLFDVGHEFPPETPLYGEGFTMLTETAGTIGKPRNLGYSDSGHYKIPQPVDATNVYGVLILGPNPGRGDQVVLAFSSCRRFNGRFEVRERSIRGVLDTEGLTRLRLRPTRCKQEGSGRAYDGVC